MSTLRPYLLALLIPCSVLVPGAQPLAGPVNCDDLSAVPMDFSVDYETEVQPIFTGGCANCHVESTFPLGGLRLDAGKSWFELVNQPSSQFANILRVQPGSAAQSLLFRKINCVDPALPPTYPNLGDRMPQSREPLTLENQARIYDWIQQGALATPAVPDLISKAEFETRG